MKHAIEKKVYYHDTDAGGVVYYGRYLAFLEEARTELIDATGLSVKELADSGCWFAVRECHIVYKRPARYGDWIAISAAVAKISGAQIQFEQDVMNMQNEEVLVTAKVSLVCLTKDFKPQPIPEHVRTALKSPETPDAGA